MISTSVKALREWQRSLNVFWIIDKSIRFRLLATGGNGKEIDQANRIKGSRLRRARPDVAVGMR